MEAFWNWIYKGQTQTKSINWNWRKRVFDCITGKPSNHDSIIGLEGANITVGGLKCLNWK